MKTSDFDYNLPTELIAQSPVQPRDSSRLMVLDKSKKEIQHKKFSDIVNYLSKGDLLVWNNSKVFKARLKGEIMLDESTDNIDNEKEKKLNLTDKILNMPKVEIFLVRPMENKGVWQVLAKPGKKLRLGMKVVFADDFSCEVMIKEKGGTVLVDFGEEAMIVRAKANKYGQVPIPPYIEPSQYIENDQLETSYQTVYSKEEGSVAAPTAGFHFSEELIEELKKKEVEFAEVTLHVGLGTFLPVKSENIEEHQMHSEWVELTDSNANKINKAKHEGRRVVAVGTTTVRTLEGIMQVFHPELFPSRHPERSEGSLKKSDRVTKGSFTSLRSVQDDKGILRMTRKIKDDKNTPIHLHPYTGDINIFITPGFQFKIIDSLITNFHLPKSTLLMLVSAFVEDREYVLKCYEEAVKQKYRFFSFGDAMLIK